MILKATKLPSSERFAGSASILKNLFSNIEQLSAYLGYLSKTFSFDSRCANKPHVVGQIVASLQISRERSAILQLYAIARSKYPAHAVDEFEHKVLPQLKVWLDRQLSKKDTEIIGCEEIAIEWTGSTHLKHEIRWL